MTGKALRLSRVLAGRRHAALLVAFDHAAALGPIPGTLDPEGQLRLFAESGADGVLVNPGLLRSCAAAFQTVAPPALIVRLDWTNVWALPGDAAAWRSVLLARPEAALRAGADAAMVFLFLGSGNPDFEAAEIRRVADVAEECERIGLPLIVEALSRGPGIAPGDPERAPVHTRVAVELGADAIKTEYTGSRDSMRRVVEACPAPVLVLGGSRLPSEDAALDLARDAAAAGAAGVFFGRNVFQAADVRGFLGRLRGALQ